MDAQKIKSNKYNKRVIKSKTNNGDAEVFVLPPDLLQKLGINLGTVNSDQQLPLETSTKRDCFDQDQIKNAQSMFSSSTDQTISETASLLKESILITGSPTLVTTECKIAGEIEISNGALQGNNTSKFAANSALNLGKGEINGKLIHNYKSDTLHKADIRELDAIISDDKICTNTVVEKISCIGPSSFNKAVAAVENHLEEDKDENKNYYEITDENKKLLKDRIRSMVINKYTNVQEMDVKDSVIHKTLNDCIETSKPLKPLNCSDDLLNESKVKSFKIPSPDTTSKISIISEEIVDSSKLRGIKSLKAQGVVDLTPITIKSVVTVKKTENIKNVERKLHTINTVGDTPNLSLSLTNVKNSEDPEKCNLYNNVLDSAVINQKNIDNFSTEEYMPNVGQPNFSGDQQNISEKVEHESDDLNSLKNNECSEALAVNNRLTTDVEQHVFTTKSKLCFQGVEKPGGEQGENESKHLSKFVKTYQKCKRLTKPVKNNPIKSTNQALCVAYEIDTEEINSKVSQEQCIYPEYCICEDFGILNFYDDIKEYQHMHFWKRDTACVNAELIFSIYDDEYCNKFGDVDFSSSYIDTEENSDNVCINFCWNEYGDMKSKLGDCDGFYEQINISYNYEHTKELGKENCGQNDNERKQSPSTEILASNSDNKSLKQKESDMLDSFEVSGDIMNDDNMGLLKSITDYKLLLTNSDGPKTEESAKELLSKNNKDSSSDHQYVSVTKEIETPTPKRRRGRPRKQVVEPISDTCESREDKANKKEINEDIVDRTPVDDNKTCVESSPRSKRDRKRDSVTASDTELSKRASSLRTQKDAVDNSELDAEDVIKNNTGLKRKRSSHDPITTSIDDSLNTESPKELVPVNSNKEISSDSLVGNIAKDVDTPPPKRKRGRPRKYFPLVPDPSNKDENKLVDETATTTGTPAKDQNITIEATQTSRKRNGSTNVTAELSENQCNEDSVRTPRECTKRVNRYTSSHSTTASNEDDITQDISDGDDNDVQCGVCDEAVKSSTWIRHIAKEHDYLAWRKGSSPLDLDDELEVKNHLQNILKDTQVLICYKCGLRRKYITSYLKHTKICDSDYANVSTASQFSQVTDPDASLEISELNVSLKNSQEEVRCGVCSKDMQGTDWIPHIQREHNYLAWVEGQTPLDVNDSAEVQKYLMALAKKLGGLTCYKCRLVRKYANIYLQHVKSCDALEVASPVDTTPLIPCSGGNVRCGVCLEEVLSEDWKQHAMKKHYNVAWIAGETPIDVKNFYVVESYLKEYKNKHNNKLACRACGVTKVSFCGFYAHIIQCGKSEEESDKYKEFCDICNKKYLCIYKSQHMTMHREKEYARERKLKLAELKKQTEPSEDTSGETPGRRRAAEKAKIVIAKYKDEFKSNTKKGDTDFTNGYSSDSDVSVKLEQYTDDESEDTDENSNISEEEQQDIERKKKRVAESSAPTITRIPFPIKNVKAYIHESFEDFCNNHLTKERLFPDWVRCNYQILSDDDVNKYMPIMEESCKVNVAQEGWTSYKRFEAKKKQDCISLFVGASIQCLAWVPAHLEDNTGDTGNFLSVACHSGTDSPRFNCDEAPEHSNLLQIWNFGDLQNSMPTLALALAHDYGTIWAMDWCPSGARDLIKDENNAHSQKRLGLLAIACSNGTAYIFSVPFPSTIVKDNRLFYKIKPVAELRLSSIVGTEKKYQATSLRWSLQKGHNIIMVGYSEGTVAYYDLSNESPFLVTNENGITVINPFYDERSHNSCVTGVDLYAGGDTYWRGGVASSASPSGARVVTGAPARGSALLSALACAGAYFLPHWPSAVLTAVNSKVNQTVNEVEWQSAGGSRGGWRSGRRVGGVRARAACARCGALGAAADPLLCVLRAHPALQHITKHVAAIIEMAPLAQKRKQTNDELAMKLEPLTYEDAVQKYGIEFELMPRKDKAYQQKVLSTPMLHYPERFPLAEITSMSFCTAVAHHNTLAVATHAGIIFLINV
ncbi:uncharacterized protein LOC115441048 isoform X2 [Manduca sexta]|uniref:uncharacterized protein LOC115441048 isoform X2 n=1 Tax=Manduca sexta TaxID=7130 RepID=UPI00188F16FB|nr:uncharacterized protein LOC115441048 isoform X2 [Manduca sexta]